MPPVQTCTKTVKSYIIKIVMPIKFLTNKAILVRNAKSEAGFTLIESMIVLAIGSLLGMMVLFGQGEIRVRVQFADAVELAKNTLVSVKNEANTTVNGGGGSGGTNINQIFFAKRVTFTNNSSTIQVDTLVIDPGFTNINVLPGSTYSTNLPWGVTYKTANSLGVNSTGSEVLFVRWPPTGKLYTFTPSLGGGFNDTNFSSYDPTNLANRTQKDYQLEGADNLHQAVLQVEGTTGTIGRIFN